MAKLIRATKGPKTGPQMYVKYCPNCRGDIRPVDSNGRNSDDSHRYQCDVCGREFEVNDLYMESVIQ